MMKPLHKLVTYVAVVALASGYGVESYGQEVGTISGVISDEFGGVIAGVQVTLRDAAGSAVQETTTDDQGTFSLSGLLPDSYLLAAENDLFETSRRTVVVSGDETRQFLRVTMRLAAFIDEVVVTGRRVEARRVETPQKIEIITARDIERTVANDLTDVLKKSSGVDVIQYPGLLSGIGIRGFRPQFSGINKRSLLLIDGRPSGVTNLATLRLDNVERIEVLKGPSSALYGASAMGGVVNAITKRSTGDIAGNALVTVGSFSMSEYAGHVGGSLSPSMDFDLAGNIHLQNGDFRMGNGVTRPATSFATYDGSARLGGALSNNWRLDGSFNGFVGRDIFTPGDVFDGESNQGSKDLERWTGDIRLTGQRGAHLLTATGFVASDQSHSSRVTSTNPADVGFLPFLSFERDNIWTGLQVRDTWNWRSGNSLSFGADYEWVGDKSKSYQRTGDRRGPFSADNTRTTIGVYAENTVRLNDGATVVSLGGRLDHITTETFDTPFKTGFTPSAAGFTTFNPSVGFKQELTQDVRLHATVGRAFVPPSASRLTGFFEGFRGGRPQLTQGNPDLRPERSTGYDVGVEWFGRDVQLDVTYFQTHVADRIVGSVVISDPGPPAPVIVSYVNSLGSRMYGMELDYSHNLSSHVAVFSNVTHYFSRREELPNAGERNILNVASNTVRVGVDLDFARMSSRLSARYVEGRQDNDWNVAGIPIIDYPDFTVVDFTTRYQLANAHALLLEMNNLFDEFYFEKKGFPLSGFAFALKYQLDFGRP